MKLSIVIICWNDWKVIQDCLKSIYANTHRVEFEVIVSDNGSSDGSVERIREQFPYARVVENHANLGFARGNNTGIRESRGEYVLILNPDTIVHEGSLDRWVDWAERHPEAGAFGCRVLNPNGTYQESARPSPTAWRDLIAALYLRPLAYLGENFSSDCYYTWKGDTEREVDWQSGCCVMLRGELLRKLGGFDERFFYHFEEVDLCYRVREVGYSIRFNPNVTITHLGGQSVARFPLRFALETNRNRYRYFYKHFGKSGARNCRRVALTSLRIRYFGFRLAGLFHPTESMEQRLETYRVAIRWNRLIDPVDFAENGREPKLEQATAVQQS